MSAVGSSGPFAWRDLDEFPQHLCILSIGFVTFSLVNDSITIFHFFEELFYLINRGKFTVTIMLHREIQEMRFWVSGPSSQLKFSIATQRFLVFDVFVFLLHPFFIITNILLCNTTEGDVILRIWLTLLIVNTINEYCPPGKSFCGCWNGESRSSNWCWNIASSCDVCDNGRIHFSDSAGKYVGCNGADCGVGWKFNGIS